MTDVSDNDVVMLAPEERNGVITLATAKDVARGNLTLTLGHHEMLDPDALARVRVWPAGHVSGGEDARLTRLEVFVHGNASIERKACLLGQCRRRLDTDTHHHEVGVERAATTERDPPPVD